MPQELFTVSGQPDVMRRRALIKREHKTAAQRDAANQFFHVGCGVLNTLGLFTVFVLQEAEHRRLFLLWSDQHVFIADGGGDFHVLGWTSQTTYLDTQR
jgi:hypothetical protein